MIKRKTRPFLLYLIFLYIIWSFVELCLVPSLRIQEFEKEVILKGLLWLIPSFCLILRFNGSLFIKKNEMFSLSRKCWIAVPFALLFSALLLGAKLIRNGGFTLNESFHLESVIIVAAVGIAEEMVFRGMLLNAFLSEDRKRNIIAVAVNALVFLLIHFPIWIRNGILLSTLISGGFISIILLSFVFSFVFIRIKSIWPSVLLHFLWNLLISMYL